MLLAGEDVRLLADDAVALDFLHLAVGIGDEPVAIDQRAGRAPVLRIVTV